MAYVKMPIKSTLIVSLGHIGSGKSSTTEKIVFHQSGISKHIIGDKLDLATIK